jgi:CelD/BcsL family acetyltransferase involved in cellulose biosynthesis
MTAVTTTAVDWTMHTHDSLTDLRRDWDDLYARCATATPFQAHAWLDSWWRAYGRPGRLRVVAVRRGGRLVAAGAFALRHRWGATVLTPLGGALSDFTDVLLDDEHAAGAARLLAGALLAGRGWQAVDFPETRPGSAAGGALRAAWPGPSADLPASLCLDLPATPIEDLVRDLPGHARKTVRRRLNQLDRLPLDVRAVPAADAAPAVADLLRLHAAQWRGRGGNPAHLRPAFAAFLTGAVAGMITAGQAVLLEYRLDGRLVAANLIVVGADLAGGYLYGADPALREHADISTLLLSSTLPVAHGRGCATMSMLRGAEAYKSRWRPVESLNRRIVLVRPASVRGAGYAVAVRLRADAVRAAKQRLPWLRQVRDGLRRALARVGA